VSSVQNQIGVYLALTSARIQLGRIPLAELLRYIRVYPAALSNEELERLLARERLRFPGFTCLHAALVFRQLKGGRICLGVNPSDVSDGHAWVEDDAGHTWLRGARNWRQIWKEE